MLAQDSVNNNNHQDNNDKISEEAGRDEGDRQEGPDSNSGPSCNDLSEDENQLMDTKDYEDEMENGESIDKEDSTTEKKSTGGNGQNIDSGNVLEKEESSKDLSEKEANKKTPQKEKTTPDITIKVDKAEEEKPDVEKMVRIILSRILC